MKKMLFVMNPYAGQRRANRYLADILSIFNRAGYRVEAYMTGARGEATDIVRQYAPEMDLVACTAINTMCKGFDKITSVCDANIKTKVRSKPTVVALSNL